MPGRESLQTGLLAARGPAVRLSYMQVCDVHIWDAAREWGCQTHSHVGLPDNIGYVVRLNCVTSDLLGEVRVELTARDGTGLRGHLMTSNIYCLL
jgi:hypothetical protein